MTETKDYSQDFGFRLFDEMNKEFEVDDPNILAFGRWRHFCPVKLMETAKAARKLIDALMVVVNTPHSQAYLKENDPMALQQCLDALNINEQVVSAADWRTDDRTHQP